MDRRPSEPYLVISSDGHVAPSLERQLRPYCPSQYLEDFDEFVRGFRHRMEAGRADARTIAHARPEVIEAVERSVNHPALGDPAIFLSDMDLDGVAASLLFAGGQNEECIPWVEGLGMGSAGVSQELRAVGIHIYNEWLADFIATAPDRLWGLLQIPMWDIDRSIRELEWGKARGFKGVNFPAPRQDYSPYNDPQYDPFFAKAAELQLPLVTHAGSGELTGGRRDLPGTYMLVSFEVMWLSRRALPQLMFGGVFDRHPTLHLSFTEQRATWVGETLRDLDSCFLDPNRDYTDKMKKLPSEYWRDNCSIGASFMAPFEAERRAEVGVRNIMWGSDYPHAEGTWPRTRLALRNTFSGVPEDDVRLMLGENAARVFDADVAGLRQLAKAIGPAPDDLARPLAPEEFPRHRGLSFREMGIFA